jgi:hypothetical protein
MLEKLIFILTVFWIWMLIESYQNDQNQLAWFWLVLFLYIPGALIYFFSQNITPQSHKKLHPLRRLQLQQELHRVRIAAKCIGKAHQFLILGNILLDLGEFEQAKSAYDRALSKEPKNPYALWGSASVAFYQDRFAVASRHLELLLKIDPKHLQGDASLMYAKVLFNLEKWSIVKSHLQEDIYYWGHPESIIMLAKIEMQDGNIGAAKKMLENMLSKLRDSPAYHYRRYRQVAREAESILRHMPTTVRS